MAWTVRTALNLKNLQVYFVLRRDLHGLQATKLFRSLRLLFLRHLTTVNSGP